MYMHVIVMERYHIFPPIKQPKSAEEMLRTRCNDALSNSMEDPWSATIKIIKKNQRIYVPAKKFLEK